MSPGGNTSGSRNNPVHDGCQSLSSSQPYQAASLSGQYVPEQEIQDEPIAALTSTLELEISRQKREKRPVDGSDVIST